MNTSRLLSIALVLGCVSAAVPAFAGEEADQIIDRIVTGEQQFLSQMQDQQPFVETYIQELDPVESVPLKDDYLLMRLDLTKNAADTTVTESSRFKPSAWRYLYTGPGMRFRSPGFVRMAFVDMANFNRATYQFDYLRREFLGDVRCLVFQVSPINAKDGSRFVGDVWVDDVDYRIVRFNGTFTNGSRLNMLPAPR